MKQSDVSTASHVPLFLSRSGGELWITPECDVLGPILLSSLRRGERILVLSGLVSDQSWPQWYPEEAGSPKRRTAMRRRELFSALDGLVKLGQTRRGTRGGHPTRFVWRDDVFDDLRRALEKPDTVGQRVAGAPPVDSQHEVPAQDSGRVHGPGAPLAEWKLMVSPMGDGAQELLGAVVLTVSVMVHGLKGVTSGGEGLVARLRRPE